MCPLYGHVHDMNSCKVMKAQSKSMKKNLSTSRGSKVGRLQFQGAKKRPAKGQELNTLVSNAISEVLKQNKRAKSAAMHGSGLEDDP